MDTRARNAAAALAACFVVLACWVAIAGSFPGDEWVLVHLYDAIGTSWDDAMVTVGDITDLAPLVAVSLVTAAVLIVMKRRPEAVRFTAIVAVVFVVNPILKVIVNRPRPDIRPSPEELSSFSFPSGHAASTAAVVGGFVLLVRSPARRRWAAVVGAAALALVGFSRLAIGVHYPSDIGGAWLWVAAWIVVVWSTSGDDGAG